MNKSRYFDLLNLSERLICLRDSELLTQLVADAGYDLDSSELSFLVNIVANAIHAELVS